MIMLYVLNDDFEILGTIPTFQTLIWNRKNILSTQRGILLSESSIIV